MKKIISSFITVAVLLTSLANTIAFASNTNTAVPTLTGLSPEFIDYINAPEEYTMVPTPITMTSEISGINLVGASNLPSKYDAREAAIVPEVRYQGVDGNCWSFSTMGALETTYDMKNAGFDYSEQHMAQTAGNNPSDNRTFDFEVGQGGNSTMASAYLARWSGPVAEQDAPYNTETLNTNYAPIKHVQNIQYLPAPNNGVHLTANLSYRAKLKEKIKEFGSVSTSYGHYDESYNPETFSYYYQGGNKISHAVTLIGWDDNYSASSFNQMPDDNGAWIARNSWSETFGDNGYFYISYYDKLIGTDATAYPDPENTDNYENIYQYDVLGMGTSITYNSNEIWMSNRFDAQKGNEAVEAVSLYTVTENTTCYVYVDTNADDGIIEDFKDDAYVAYKNFELPGYYTINLPKPMTVTGKSFTVSVKMVTTSVARAPVETPIKNFTTKATAQAGQSYIRYGHQAWVDATTIASNTNVCLKAFTSKAPEFNCEIQAVQTSKTEISVSFNKSEESTSSLAYILVTSSDRESGCSDVQIVPVTLTQEGEQITFTIPEQYKHVKVFMFEESDGMTPMAEKCEIPLN